jgi:hypothetical protein
VVGCDPEVENANAVKMRVYTISSKHSGQAVTTLQNLGVKKKNIEVIKVEGEYYWIEAYLTPKQRLDAMKSPVVRSKWNAIIRLHV